MEIPKSVFRCVSCDCLFRKQWDEQKHCEDCSPLPPRLNPERLNLADKVTAKIRASVTR